MPSRCATALAIWRGWERRERTSDTTRRYLAEKKTKNCADITRHDANRQRRLVRRLDDVASQLTKNSGHVEARSVSRKHQPIARRTASNKTHSHGRAAQITRSHWRVRLLGDALRSCTAQPPRRTSSIPTPGVRLRARLRR